MADGVIAITAGSGTPIRAVTGVGPNVADQQVVTLADSAGNLLGTAAAPLPVVSRVASLGLTTGTIASATGVVTATSDIPNAGTVTVGIYGTFAGVVLIFEASPDGTNWFPVNGQRTDTYEISQNGSTPTLTFTAQFRAWDIPLPGFVQFRVRATAWTSGTVSVVIAPAVNPFEVAPSVGLVAAPAYEWQPPDVSSITTIGVFDALSYQSVKVQLIQVVTWTGVSVVFETSNDQVTWTSLVMINQSSTTGVGLTSISFTGQFYANLTGRYLRVRTASWTAGTVRVMVEMSPQPIAPHVMGAVINQIASAAALTDGYANPTVGHIAGDMLEFNGTTWDRVRNNNNVPTGDTGAKTVTFNGATQTNYNNTGVVAMLILGTVSGTSPTLVAKMQGSPDGGTTWYDIAGATTASIVATGTYTIECFPGATVVAGTATTGSVASASHPVPRTWRLVYTIGGTSPSFTITSVQVAYIG